MVDLKEKIDLESINKEAYEHVMERIREGELYITDDKTSDNDFWRQFKKLKKEKEKFVKNFRKYYNNPQRAVLEFEKILYAFELTGTLASEDVQANREKLYEELGKPEEYASWIRNKRKELGV